MPGKSGTAGAHLRQPQLLRLWKLLVSHCEGFELDYDHKCSRQSGGQQAMVVEAVRVWLSAVPCAKVSRGYALSQWQLPISAVDWNH